MKLSTIHQDGAFYYVGGEIIILFGMLVITDLAILWGVWLIAYAADYELPILVLTITSTIILGAALVIVFLMAFSGCFLG